MSHPTYSREVTYYEMPSNQVDRKRLEFITDTVKDTLQTKLDIDSMLELAPLCMEVRDMLKHGEFYKWIKLELKASHQKIHSIIHVYNLREHRKVLKPLQTSVLYAVAAPSVPKDVLDKVIDRLRSGYPVKLNDFRDLKEGLEI
jgi:hypothetical protein